VELILGKLARRKSPGFFFFFAGAEWAERVGLGFGLGYAGLQNVVPIAVAHTAAQKHAGRI